jgi:2-hydroxychromene-2-carboxylate isomerase
MRWRLVEALYLAAWVHGLRVDRSDVVAAVATKAGFEGPTLVDQAGLPESKERLREQTKEAIALGAFGVPTFLVDQNLFFGVDSLPLLDRFLGGERIEPQQLARWQSVVPSAQRRGIS